MRGTLPCMANYRRSMTRSVEDHFGRLSCSGHWSALYQGTPDSRTFSFRIRRARVLELLEGHGGRVLDLGCGPGVMIPDLLERGWEFYGLDASAEILAEAETVASSRADRARVHLRRGDVCRLDYPDASFDAVLAMGLLEYLSSDEIVVALMNIRRVLRDGGIAVMSIPKRWHLDRVVVTTLGPVRWALRPIREKVIQTPRDTIRRTRLQPRELDRLMAAHGFDRVDGLSYSFTPLPYPITALLPRLSQRVNAPWERFARCRGWRVLASGYIGKYVRRPAADAAVALEGA